MTILVVNMTNHPDILKKELKEAGYSTDIVKHVIKAEKRIYFGIPKADEIILKLDCRVDEILLKV